MIMNNPFVIGKIVSREHFCDRQEELAWIKRDLLGSQSVVLYSPRRLGKSSLIRVALQELPGKGALCAYLNLMGLGSLQEVVEALARTTTQAMVQNLGGIQRAFQRVGTIFRRIGVQFGIDPVTNSPVYSFTLRPEALEGDLEDVLTSFDTFANTHGLKAVVALDEFQELLNIPGFGKRAEAVMRRIAEGLPHTAFIFAGSKHHLVLSMFTKLGSPLYRGAKLYELGPLPLSECVEFLKKRFTAGGLDVKRDVCQEIAGFSQGHPYVLQYMGSVIFDLLASGYEPDNSLIPEAIKQMFAQLSSEYELLWDSLSNQPRARQLLRLLAIHGPVKRFSQMLLQKYGLSPSTTSVAARNLWNMGLVWPRDKGGWKLVDPLFAAWLKRPPGEE